MLQVTSPQKRTKNFKARCNGCGSNLECDLNDLVNNRGWGGAPLRDSMHIYCPVCPRLINVAVDAEDLVYLNQLHVRKKHEDKKKAETTTRNLSDRESFMSNSFLRSLR